MSEDREKRAHYRPLGVLKCSEQWFSTRLQLAMSGDSFSCHNRGPSPASGGRGAVTHPAPHGPRHKESAAPAVSSAEVRGLSGPHRRTRLKTLPHSLPPPRPLLRGHFKHMPDIMPLPAPHVHRHF